MLGFVWSRYFEKRRPAAFLLLMKEGQCKIFVGNSISGILYFCYVVDTVVCPGQASHLEDAGQYIR